jgi:hypothetical protein
MKSNDKARHFTNPAFAVPLLDLGVDFYTTPSSPYSSPLLARPSLLARRPQPSTSTYTPTSNFARRPNLFQITKPHDNKSNPKSQRTVPKQNLPLQSSTFSSLLSFYPFLDLFHHLRAATCPAAITATSQPTMLVSASSFEPRNIGRRIRFITTPSPYRIPSRVNDTLIQPTTQHHAGHFRPYPTSSQNSNYLGLIHPRLGPRL